MKKAAETRLNLLQKAFDLMYEKGYQATSIDDIIATTKVTKGAFYYHFKTKDEMGLAIINEIMRPAFTSSITEPLQKDMDPLEAIYHLMESLLLKNDLFKVEYGCPAGNFTQEMAPWNAAFTEALDEVMQEGRKVMTTIIGKGIKNGLIRKDVNAKQVALFVVSGYWGIRSFGKLANSRKIYLPYLKELKSYLGGLR